MQTLVVMQKAGRTFGYCEASSKVVGRDIFEGESGVVLKDFIKWPELEEFKYLAMGPDVGKEPPEFTGNHVRRPRDLLTSEQE
jgi:hypothetical protein